MRDTALLLLVLLAGCAEPGFAPVEITADDTCATCRMAVSDRRYAAEVLDHDGGVFKFDDIGCMANFLRSRAPHVGAEYVTDYETRAWVHAEQAYYVESLRFQTPMGSGIVAFAEAARAHVSASREAGKVLHFSEIVVRRP